MEREKEASRYFAYSKKFSSCKASKRRNSLENYTSPDLKTEELLPTTFYFPIPLFFFSFFFSTTKIHRRAEDTASKKSGRVIEIKIGKDLKCFSLSCCGIKKD
jgi:hypothetical protein